MANSQICFLQYSSNNFDKLTFSFNNDHLNRERVNDNYDDEILKVQWFSHKSIVLVKTKSEQTVHGMRNGTEMNGIMNGEGKHFNLTQINSCCLTHYKITHISN